MKLQINGNDHQSQHNQPSLPQLLEELGLQGQPLLVEHNGTALHPSEQQQLQLKEGDRLELMRMVAGG